ncbi:hypothetical protein [Telluribacter sp.]|jgi:O-antigen/teichoic acid export membrane protein|uniref:hypothetical protein n=1 Tax=Telluribacter sp. TaxID=1978767 RepID=UPI002E131F80|nr:hypothetical protein [Telluribacter sp.]
MRNLFLKNASTSILQLAVSATSIGIQYKFVIDYLGVEQLGLWSIILSISSILNLSNGGLSGGIVKFTSEYSKSKNLKRIIILLNASIVFTIVTWIIIASVVYIIIYIGNNYINIQTKYIHLANKLLLYSFLNLLISILSQLYFAVAEGLKKTYIKSYTYITFNILFLPLILWATINYGLIGLCLAQLVQSILILIGAILSTYKLIKYHMFQKIHKIYFLKIITINFQIQIAMLFRMAYEPLAKLLLTNFAGLSVVGYFEIASKIATYFRTASNVTLYNIIPYVSELTKNKNTDYHFADLYAKTSNAINFIMLITQIVLLNSLPAISYILLGNHSITFYNYAFIVGICTIINGLSLPAYYFNFGLGYLKSILNMHIIMVTLLLLLGFIIYFLKVEGTALFPWSFSYIIGSLYMIHSFSKKYNRKIILDINIKTISIAFIFSVASYLYIFKVSTLYIINWQVFMSSLLTIILFIGILSIFYKETLQMAYNKYINKI